MNSNPQNQYAFKLQTFSEVSSVFIILVGVLFLIGWAFDIGILKAPGSNFPTIKSNTAFSFILIGICIWLLQEKRLNQRNLMIARILSIIVLLIGLFTLSEYITGFNLGIDQILFIESGGAFQTGALNRMSLVAALSLLLVGISLLTIDKRDNRNFQLFQLLTVLVGLISFLIILGYLYQTAIYPLRNTTAPSPYVSAVLIIIALAIMASRPKRGFMEILMSNRIGSVFGRKIIPSIILIPLIIGWLRLLGEKAGFYDAEFGTAITIFSTIVLLIILVGLSIISIDKTDIKRIRAEENIKKQANLLNLTHDAIFVRNLDDEITFWNNGSEKTYGWNQREVLGRVTHELLQAEYPKPLDQIQEDVLNYGQWDGELKHKKRDGTPIIVLSRWSLQKDENGNPTGFLEINTDITKRKDVEEKLKKSVDELKPSKIFDFRGITIKNCECVLIMNSSNSLSLHLMIYRNHFGVLQAFHNYLKDVIKIGLIRMPMSILIL